MKKTVIAAIMLAGFSTLTKAQEGRIGINTADPKTTMDVRGKADTSGVSLSTDITGLQAPRLTRAELTAKGNTLYGADQKGALVYITDITGGDVASQRVNITTAGYYYFDGTLWQTVKGGSDNDWKVTGNSGTTRGTNYIGTNDDNDLMFKTNGKYRMHINNHGGIVIGDSAQVYNSNMLNNFTGVRIQHTNEDVQGNLTANPPKPAFGIANSLQANVKAGTSSTGSIRSFTTRLDLSAETGGSKPGGDVSGASIYAYRAPISGSTDGTGTIVAISGLNINAGNGTGSIGTTSRFYGVNLNPNNQGAGTITDYYGYYMGLPNGNTGTITNKYAVYIANDWSNYFNGKVGIGTTPLTAPTNQLHVKAPTDPVRIEGFAAGSATDNVVTVDATGVLKTLPSSTFASDLRLVNTNNHITQDAGVGSNGTSVGTGTINIGIGPNALSQNTTGDANTAIGRNTLKDNTTGRQNIAVGIDALSANTTGQGNVAIGNVTLRKNTTGISNTAVGQGALTNSTTAYNNTAVGSGSMMNTTTGSNSTAVGKGALQNNTTGDVNTAIGYSAMEANITGAYNTALGDSVLRRLTSGDRNVVVGRGSLQTITTSTENTVLGSNIMTTSTSGDYNTIVGTSAFSAGEGSRNTIIGYRALLHSTSGNDNIVLGANTDVFSSTGSNQMNIGNIIFGNGLTGTLAAPAGNIGIGVTNPAKKLEVNGTIKATDINFTGLQTFNNDAAAGTGGLASGDVYKTASGDLKIKL
jgi:hypothetical protein